MPQLENIEAIEKRLWKSADTLRANSSYASNEYFLPVMGLVFLRHAYSRYLRVKAEIEPNLPTRGGKTLPLSKEHFSAKSAIFLRPEAQFDSLVALPDSADRIKAVIHAMESIESDYTSLRGSLPKQEYQALDNEILGQLLRNLNPDELRSISGDVFGRIYEYFLTQFADQKAHDGGEFFTPVSLVSFMARTIDPQRGKVLDPACGSGGMFVQSARTVEEHGENPTEKLTFYGLEKNPTTIRLAKMNLAVHGLEGNINQAITYYEHPHELVGKCDYVMANPPFNVDEIDAEKVKSDPRLAFGLPGVNKGKKVSNGNYVWISYFYSYLNETGRGAFVMSSQASSAGGKEAEVRQKLVETGAVDAMVAIRSNFFYTRTVPCELWFLEKAKPAALRDKVLMLDARNVFRKVTRKIYDFSPEHEKNLLAIVSLHRGEEGKFHTLVSSYLQSSLAHAGECVSGDEPPLEEFINSLQSLIDLINPFLGSLDGDGPQAQPAADFAREKEGFMKQVMAFQKEVAKAVKSFKPRARNFSTQVDSFTLPNSSRELIKSTDHLYKLMARLIEILEKECDAGRSDDWAKREISRARKSADDSRHLAVEELKQVSYFHRHARWLTSRFPKGKLIDVPGLVKLVGQAELAANDWSLTPGRYVGVAPEEVDEDFDFEETMGEIHLELKGLNEEAAELAERIQRNFEEMGI